MSTDQSPWGKNVQMYYVKRMGGISARGQDQVMRFASEMAVSPCKLIPKVEVAGPHGVNVTSNYLFRSCFDT